MSDDTKVKLAVIAGVVLLGVFISAAQVGRERAAAANAYSRGYAAAVDSVRAHEEWGYVLMRGNQRLKLTPGIVDSLWLCPEALDDVTAIAIGRGRR